jgi:hypothetical protein
MLMVMLMMVETHKLPFILTLRQENILPVTLWLRWAAVQEKRFGNHCNEFHNHPEL